jgi:Na+/H+ antiporter NhaA
MNNRAFKLGAALAVLLWAVAAFAQIPGPPTENVDAWYEWILVWLMRPGVAAVLAGLVLAFVVPQRAKMDLPHKWPADRRRRMTRRISFVSGFIPTALLWPLGWNLETMSTRDIYIIVIAGLLTATLVGASAPWTYSVVMNQLYKRGWLSEMKWSGEARAAAKRVGETTSSGIPVDTQ